MSKRYKVSFEIVLDDTTSHPRKWVPEAVWANLTDGEDIYNWGFEELTDDQQDEDNPC